MSVLVTDDNLVENTELVMVKIDPRSILDNVAVMAGEVDILIIDNDGTTNSPFGSLLNRFLPVTALTPTLRENAVTVTLNNIALEEVHM